MPTEKTSFIKFCLIMAAAIVGVLTLMTYGPKPPPPPNQVVVQKDPTMETKLGNNITRIFDPKYSVVCYNRNSGQFSCVYIPRDKLE